MLSTTTKQHSSELETYLNAQANKDQLRFLTCGSVDDGKSTLLGRMLYDSKSVFEDQLSNTKAESRQYGTQGDKLDLALLVDGLQARSEEHTSELQSRRNLVCRLLLEKKKKKR